MSKKFSTQVARFVKISKEDANTTVRKIALGLLSNIVIGSPVDTGRFRGNWQVGLDSRPTGTVSGVEKNPGPVIMKGEKEIRKFEMGGLLYITNNLPYARRLEFGWSKQAPRGMVRLAMRNIKAIVKDALKK